MYAALMDQSANIYSVTHSHTKLLIHLSSEKQNCGHRLLNTGYNFNSTQIIYQNGDSPGLSISSKPSGRFARLDRVTEPSGFRGAT